MDEEAYVAIEVGPLVRIPLAIVCQRYGHFDRYVEMAIGLVGYRTLVEVRREIDIDADCLVGQTRCHPSTL
jgi:hypothetical protein